MMTGRRWSARTIPFLSAAALGAAGGTCFYVLRLPLPWLLGSMSFCVAAALLRLPVAVPARLALPTSAIIGAMIGSGFAAGSLAGLQSWILPICGMVGLLLLGTAICLAYFRFVARYDPMTAFFCAIPGGLSEMILLGERYGADFRRIALVHSGRIVLIVFLVPILVEQATGIDLARSARNGMPSFEISLEGGAWLVAICGLGAILGCVLRMPTPFLLGPMILGGAIHAFGLTDVRPPELIVIAAQVSLGSAIGSRFSGVAIREIAVILLQSLGATALLLGLAVVVALGVSIPSGIRFADLLLAYSPGGIAEMGIIALALHAEVAFVTSIHILRIMIIVGGVSIFLVLRPRR